MTHEEIMQMAEELKLNGYSWAEVADIINEDTQDYKSSDAYRCAYYRWKKTHIEPEEVLEEVEEDNLEQIYELKKEKMQIADYRNEVNRMYRRMAREDSIKDIAHDAAELIAKEHPFKIPPKVVLDKLTIPEAGGILCLSDWHYGAVIDSVFNSYDPSICCKRLVTLCHKVEEKLKQNNCKDLCIVNLGDLVNGIIHTQIRINNRIDVITQIMEVSEILGNVIYYFRDRGYAITYVSTMDNHSRIMPEKKDSLDCESLCRITDWYLKERCKDLDINFIENTYGDDIATFKVFNHNIAAAHGDKDTPSKIIQNLTLLTRQPYDLVLTAHRHHFQSEELNECMMIANGSVMGTDSYAESLRLSNKPSQTLVIATPDNVIDTIYKINLD